MWPLVLNLSKSNTNVIFRPSMLTCIICVRKDSAVGVIENNSSTIDLGNAMARTEISKNFETHLEVEDGYFKVLSVAPSFENYTFVLKTSILILGVHRPSWPGLTRAVIRSQQSVNIAIWDNHVPCKALNSCLLEHFWAHAWLHCCCSPRLSIATHGKLAGV